MSYRRICDACDVHIPRGNYALVALSKNASRGPFESKVCCTSCAPHWFTSLLKSVLNHEFAELDVRWEETI